MAYEIREEICLNADRSAVVACDSPQAHFKLSPPNSTLTDEEAVALGLLKEGEAQEPAPAEEAAPVVEMGGEDEPAPPAEKAVAPAANKAVSGAAANKKK